jgi:mannosylglycoprotein endo-beta-mannosidase
MRRTLATVTTFPASFPHLRAILTQTYLGLPLSAYKLPPSAFQPIIDSCDRYLAGWRASLLSKGGRLILLSSVLDSLPTYFMSSFLLPKSIIKLIDTRRRAFFWAADESCSGAQCLVAWRKVFSPKLSGGLGAKKI